LKQIAKKLAEAEPESFSDICGLLDFALTSIDPGTFIASAVLALKNVRENIGLIWRSEERRAREEAWIRRGVRRMDQYGRRRGMTKNPAGQPSGASSGGLAQR
jgi:hypothetical protein